MFTYMKSIFFFILILASINCATTQQRVAKLKVKNENTLTLQLHGNKEQAKAAVREAGREMKLIERVYGTKTDFEKEDENFMLLTNNRLKSGFLSMLFGSFLWTPINVGIFFEYDEKIDVTSVTISEEVSTFNFQKRKELYWKLMNHQLERREGPVSTLNQE
jgi:hypothetical protein